MVPSRPRGGCAWWEKVIKGPAAVRGKTNQSVPSNANAKGKVSGSGWQRYLVYPGKRPVIAWMREQQRAVVRLWRRCCARPGSVLKCRPSIGLLIDDRRPALAHFPLHHERDAAASGLATVLVMLACDG